MLRSTSGQRTKYTSSSTAPVAACGCPRKPRTPCCCIIRRGRSVGYFGAVRLRDGKFQFSRETGKFNAVTFLVFLKQLRRTSIRIMHRLVVITDDAKYHHARLHKELRATDIEDFVLDYLPPYSHDLKT